MATHTLKRLLNSCLLLAFLAGYLEWGKRNHLFIFQAQAEIFSKAITNPASVLHPFILIPFSGEIMILFTVFQKMPGRVLSLAGTACLSSIMLFLFFIGIMSANIKILGSTVPFLIAGVLVLRIHWKRDQNK